MEETNMTVTQWLTIPEAALRVGRSKASIYSWIRGGHLRRHEITRGTQTIPAVIEQELLETDRLMRSRRGRPKKVDDDKA